MEGIPTQGRLKHNQISLSKDSEIPLPREKMADQQKLYNEAKNKKQNKNKNKKQTSAVSSEALPGQASFLLNITCAKYI